MQDQRPQQIKLLTEDVREKQSTAGSCRGCVCFPSEAVSRQICSAVLQLPAKTHGCSPLDCRSKLLQAPALAQNPKHSLCFSLLAAKGICQEQPLCSLARKALETLGMTK